ncbi:MAG TPA: zinc-ribbon domain-containing protein, partial [Gemmataceae bacterium]|nr:zinc-ribbon domain-containing protein [Gemmataceae bacterium]
MPFQIVCPGCQARFQLAEEMRGKILRCSKCQQMFAAGTPAPAARPAPARPPEAPKPAPPTTVTTARPSAKKSAAPAAKGPTTPAAPPKPAAPEGKRRSATPWVIGGVGAAGCLLLVLTAGGGLGAWFLFGSRS